MKNSMKVRTNGLSGLNLFRAEMRSGAFKGYSKMWFIVLLLVVLMAGCGSGSSSGGHTPPTLSSEVPARSATGVALDSNISATFSNKMDALTINTTTFTVTAEPDTPVAGKVALSADGVTAVFTPRSYLTANTKFDATLTPGVKDLNGKAFAGDFWTFTTGSTLSPTVDSTVPIDFATGVATNVIISAEFSVAMDPLTINTTTFTVTPENGKLIEGIVALSADGLTATFTPTAALAANTQFLARVTTGVKDVPGNAMKADKAWVFQTAP